MKRIRTLFVFLLLFMSLAFISRGQSTPASFDTLISTAADTLSAGGKKKFDYAKRFDPRRALLFSAVMPGMGQVYNKKYWKLPLVYGGLGAGVYVMNFYQDQYRQYRNELLESLSTQTFPSAKFNLSEATLRRGVDFYRRKRDFTIVLLGLGYLLQIVDAHVDAHLKEFKYNPNLRVSLEPEINQDPVVGRTSGMALKFTF